jgi:RNA polymerase sigma-70 factor (sigma-E family)
MIASMEVTGSRAFGTSRADELFREHAPAAVQLAFLLTGDRHTAEDIAQDAFVRMFGRFQDLRKPESFRFYLRRTVVNLCRDHFRRSRRRDADLTGSEPDPSEEVPFARLEEQDRLLQALQQLPIRQRTAVVLRHCEGLSEEETADAMRTSNGAVNSLVSRGVARLRQLMEGDRS